ncbi:hypothetical protein [Yersinia pekkanenii]|uniref:Uncharacterized protein n=1 Tax=Yersinia pekkanenii TaxID=1288385 RepID=A0A0T9Q228_9GAMM|nr:hypothetical protein [Yersinia pekkanenii]CNH92432.1 Uncharacterised protein [Yersinia pekkanenii]CRY68571.1 Uncharacterised protein [Yersinia pekkanenii]
MLNDFSRITLSLLPTMPPVAVKKKQDLPVSLINPAYLLIGTVTNSGDSIHWLKADIEPKNLALQVGGQQENPDELT